MDSRIGARRQKQALEDTQTGTLAHKDRTRNKRTHKYRHYRTQRRAQEDTQTLNIGRKDRNKSKHGQEQEETKTGTT